MGKMICPYCEEDLSEDPANILHKDRNFVNCTIGGSASIIDIKPNARFTFAMVTCPCCNKILGAVNSSPIPIP